MFLRRMRSVAVLCGLTVFLLTFCRCGGADSTPESTQVAAAKGAAPKGLFEPNSDTWSGEHAASDVDATPGIFLCNQTVNEEPSLIDLGVTALKYMGIDVPAEFEGKGLL